jgi:hypothetical protein
LQIDSTQGGAAPSGIVQPTVEITAEQHNTAKAVFMMRPLRCTDDFL